MVVLIVDDERIVAESTAQVFRLAGHEAHAVTRAEAALDLAGQVRPDILITDVVMPGSSGIDLAIEFCHRMPACKVLLISGQAETSDLLDTAAQRGYSFEIVAKPLWPPDLIKRAEEMVRGGDNADAAKVAD